MREVGIEEIVDSTLAIYCGEAPRLFAGLSDAVAAGDLETIRATAHSLKSSSGSIRAGELAKLLADLESAAMGEDISVAVTSFPQVREEFDRVMGELEAGSSLPSGAPASLRGRAESGTAQLDMFNSSTPATAPSEAEATLRGLEIERMTPIEALVALARLKDLLPPE